MKKPLASLAILLLLTACQREQPAPQSSSPTPVASAARSNAATGPWFICDGVDAPSVFVLEKSGDDARMLVTEYSKTDGRPAWRADFTLGEGEGAAGSIIVPLLRNGADAGNVRQMNPGMLETPGSAFTTPYRTVTFGDRTVECRWIARTRLMGFDERRTFVVHEDADGDLIYTTYDFSAAGSKSPIDLSENSRTTAYSVEVRGGTETVGPGGQEFRFENGDILYLVTVPTSGAATVEVWRGNNQIQSESLIAQEVGQGS